MSVWKTIENAGNTTRNMGNMDESVSEPQDSISFGGVENNDAVSKMFQISDTRKNVNEVHVGNVKGKKSIFKFKKSKLKKVDKTERMKQIAAV